jgi:hypothetical protein
MRATNFDGQKKYDLVGSGIEPYVASSDEDRARAYTHLKGFPGNDFYQSPPITAFFSVAIVPPTDSSDRFQDEVEFQYDTVQCTCAYRDY